MRAYPFFDARNSSGTFRARPPGASRGVVFVTFTGRNASVSPPEGGGEMSKALPLLYARDLDGGDWSYVYGGPIDGRTDLDFYALITSEVVMVGLWVPDATRVQAFALAHQAQQPTPRFDVEGEAVIVEGYNSGNSSLQRLLHPVAPLTGGAYGISPCLTRTHVTYAPKGSRGRYGGHAVDYGWSSQVDYVYTAVIQ